jgi:hypothetical protein
LDAASDYNVVLSGTCPSDVVSIDASLTVNQFNLPVELTMFSTTCELNGIAINWQTASEHNTAKFTVEKSRDGINWLTIASKDAAGNSFEPINYSFFDESNVFNEFVYYRLNQEDIDGTIKVFGPISSNCFSDVDYNVDLFPNPSIGSFTLRFLNYREQTQTIKLHDLMGNELMQKTLDLEKGTTLLPIILNDLVVGVYLLEVKGINYLKIIRLIIK